MKGKTLKRLVLHVLLGQAVAFFISLTGVSTTVLVNNDSSYPLLQSMTAYGFVFLFYALLFLFVYIRHRRLTFTNFAFLQRPWKYAILALIDMEANFVVVLAYQYTDIVSVQLLSCFTIPCVLVLSYFILKMRFAITHVLGCIVATGGLVLLVTLDADGVLRDDVGLNVAKGDLLCLLAAALYATSNVLTEWFIKPGPRQCVGNSDARLSAVTQGGENNGDGLSDHEVSLTCSRHNVVEGAEIPNTPHVVLPLAEEMTPQEVPKYIPVVENLCCMSGFGLLFATIQFFVVEWTTFAPGRATWTTENVLLQLSFGITMLFVYTGMPVLFLITSAAFANISLLAVSVYGIIWNVTVFKVYPRPIFFLSYVITVAGILIYDLSDIQWEWCPRFNYPCSDVENVAVNHSPADSSPDVSGPYELRCISSPPLSVGGTGEHETANDKRCQ